MNRTVAALALGLLTACTPPASGDIRYAPVGTAAGFASTPSGADSATEGEDAEPQSTTTSSTSTSSTTTPSTSTTTTGDPPLGIDVSHWQGDIDWGLVAADGYAFAYIKATEGTYFTDDAFFDNRDGAEAAGMLRGAYHFGIPDDSSGAEQAQFFVDNGGDWLADGDTLPGVLDIEWNPNWYDDCYGLSNAEMQDWIEEFVDEYNALTGRDPVIYTAAYWWDDCVGSSSLGSAPLWVADWGGYPPSLPNDWSDHAFWQTDAYGTVSGIWGDVDLDVFNGTPSSLQKFADTP